MQAISDVLANMAETTTKNSHSEASGYICPVCGQFVEPIEVNVLNEKRMVQPTCPCEVEKYEREQNRAENFQKRREIEKLFSISDLGERFKESRFGNFIGRLGSEKALKMARKYVTEFEEWGSDSLMLWGVPGNVKSHLAAAIANDLNERDEIVVFQSVPELLQRIRETFDRNSEESEQDIMKALLTCDLLILDDIGAEKLTKWVEDIVFRIIDGRYRKRYPIL